MGSSITTSGITFQAISEFQDQLGRIKKRGQEIDVRKKPEPERRSL